VGVDHALEPNDGHHPVAQRPALLAVEAPVVEQQPHCENGVEIGFVGVHAPGLGVEVEPLEDEHHRLFAGGEREGAHAPLVVVEVEDRPLGVEKRLCLGRTVEEDRLLGVFAGGGRVHGETALDPYRDVGRLDTRQIAAVVVLLDGVTDREHLAGGERPRDGAQRAGPIGLRRTVIGQQQPELSPDPGIVVAIGGCHSDDCTRVSSRAET
jgi:hypothetical protein